MASRKPARKASGSEKSASVSPAVKLEGSEPQVISSTPVRSTPAPKALAPTPVVSHEMIAMRAWEISQSESCGSEFENWIRAERELRGS